MFTLPIRIFRRYPKLSVLCALTLVAIAARRPILRKCAALWVNAGTASPSDAVLILGGGMDTRPFEAARLFHAGLAPTILLPAIEPNQAHALGLSLDDTELTLQLLLRQGVPRSAIQRIGNNISSTYQESVALKEWCSTQSKAPKQILIPTESLHTRRTAWIFEKMLPDTTKPVILALPHRDFDLETWWQDEQGLMTFQNEIIKTFYYFCKY